MADAAPPIATSRSRHGVFSALRRAVPVFFSARVLAVVLWPVALAVLVSIVAGVFGWTPLTRWLETATVGGDASGGLRALVAGVIAFIAFMLLAVLTALVTIAVIAMPVIVRAVADRDFPTLARRRGGTFAGSVLNAMIALACFVPAWLLSLLLLPLPPLFIAASLLLSAWLNQRLLRYDALAEHADAAEMRAIFRAARRRLFALGLVLAPLSYVPLINLFAPLYAGVAFAYLCLDELALARARAPTPAVP